MLDLSRWQWALTAAMHITFPAVTVGTSVLLVVCYAMNAVELAGERLERIGVAHMSQTEATSSCGHASTASSMPSGSPPPRPGSDGSASLPILRTTLPNCLYSGPVL
jgi:hypothetical protein